MEVPATRAVTDNSAEIMLVDNQGGGGDSCIDTVFDDEAATPITSGTAPLTGSFQPEQALSVFDSGSSLGDWTLRVIDDANNDTGTLDSRALRFTFPPVACATDIFTDAFESGDLSAWSVSMP